MLSEFQKKGKFFVFQFEDVKLLEWVLDTGPWYIGRKLLLVQKWTPELTAGRINFKRIPLWFILRNIPMHLYNSTCLSYIASAIRKPLYMDRGTTSQTHLDFARICIEVEFEDELMQSIEVDMENGQTILVDVVLPWSPERCLKCKAFGNKCERTEENSGQENAEPAVDTTKTSVEEIAVAIDKSQLNVSKNTIDSDLVQRREEVSSKKKFQTSSSEQEHESESDSSDCDLPLVEIAAMSKRSSGIHLQQPMKSFEAKDQFQKVKRGKKAKKRGKGQHAQSSKQ